MEAFFRGSHTTNFVTCGFSKSYNQAAQVPSSNVTCKSPRSPSINCRIMLAFVSMTHSIMIFPTPFITAIEMLSLCTSMPIYFVLFMRVLLFVGIEANAQNLLQKGRPLYCVGFTDKYRASTVHVRIRRYTGVENLRVRISAISEPLRHIVQLAKLAGP